MLAAAGLAGMAAIGAAHAEHINTGGERGAYKKDFCPQLSKALKKSKFHYQCVSSHGSRENIERVIKAPKEIGFSQLDVYALQSGAEGGGALSVIRSDLGRECLFVVTKNKNLHSLDDIGALGGKLRFILPSEKSGHASTFAYLQKTDPNGLGQVKNVERVESVDAALDKVLKGGGDTATLFVQFPDPDNARFKQVWRGGGHFVPVISREILGQQIGGEKVYYAQETEIATATLTKKRKMLTTACTPLVLFTGTPEAVAKAARANADKAKAEQADLIKTIKAVKRNKLMPHKGYLSNIWRRTKELSSEAADKFLAASHKAREKAQPYIDATKEKAGEAAEKAKEAGKAAVEKAKELGAKAKEKAGEAAEKAKEASKAAVEKAKELGAKAKEKAGEAAEKAKELGARAKEAVKKKMDADGKPADAKPADAKPADAKPADAKPADAKPADAKPADAKPADAKPADAKPADAKPADAKPADAKPADAKPADAKPADAKPADAKPADAKPADAKPADEKGKK
jgi:hypothetical protein